MCAKENAEFDDHTKKPTADRFMAAVASMALPLHHINLMEVHVTWKTSKTVDTCQLLIFLSHERNFPMVASLCFIKNIR